MLNTTGISGRRLRFEITEDSVLSDLAAAAERMQLLMEHEIEFSLDDFGTGYASFTYLRYLPVGEVKIDQGFVRRFLQHPQDAAIVRAIVDLGRSLGLRVVAEGVENHDQWQALREVGCEIFQGYYFDRPQLESENHLIDRLREIQLAPP
jgi:EAL domain-containing protein (putative c-di-GMP-specific phosphodiesterase class I)